jgi:DNA-directed RNA polymerase beta subunit
MTYTQEGIMAQILVAFGQGTGATRVSQDAALQLRTIYFGAITDHLTGIWGTEAVQVLERVRAIGKLAAQRAVTAGETAIGVEDVQHSARAVREASISVFCPPFP